MLEQDYIDFIRERVSSRYNMSRFDTSIEALQRFYELNASDIDFELGLIDIANAFETKRKNYLRNFNIVEIFMKALYNTVYAKEYVIAPADIDNVDEEKYSYLVRSFFHKLPEGMPLVTTDPYSLNQDYQREYLLAYQDRNKITHSSLIHKNDKEKVDDVINAALICYLDLAYDHREALRRFEEDTRRSTYINRKKYREQILNEYKNWVRDFTYMDVKWMDLKASEVSCDLSAILDSDRKCVKFLGEAGTGKTTALRRIEYLLAKTMNNDPNVPLPVYISLNTLDSGNNILRHEIARILDLDLKQVGELIENHEISLLLDGYNEVLNNGVRSRIAGEIDTFVLHYPEIRIFLTDRSVAKNSLPVMKTASEYHLFPLSLADKQRYFDLNCSDQEVLGLIKEEISENPDTFATLSTPLALKHFLDVVKETKQIPFYFTGAYINMLMDREQDEKKDINIAYLPYQLQALALLNKKVFSRDEALEVIARLNSLKGFTIPDSLTCLNLAIDMGILERESEDELSFTNEDTWIYFLESAKDSSLREKLFGKKEEQPEKNTTETSEDHDEQ